MLPLLKCLALLFWNHMFIVSSSKPVLCANFSLVAKPGHGFVSKACSRILRCDELIRVRGHLWSEGKPPTCALKPSFFWSCWEASWLEPLVDRFGA